MKKYGIILVLVCLMFVVGCVSGNYFKVPAEDEEKTTSEESDLIKEIQDIEKQLGEIDDETTEVDESLTDEETEETEETEEVLVEEEAVDTSSLQRIEVEETELVNLQVESKDLDEDIISYTFSKPLDEDGKWQTNYGDHGEYVIEITASDGKTTSMKEILLVVNKKNVPPVIEGLEDSIVVDEGKVISLSPKISDPNKDEIEVSFSEPFNELGVWETDHTSAGEYDILVSASDGELSTEVKVYVKVNDINMLPEITGLEDTITVKEGETVEINPVVTDLDNDKIELTISEPVGDDGIWKTGYTDHGEYEITIVASDGKGKTEAKVIVIVEDVNVAPEIVNISLG